MNEREQRLQVLLNNAITIIMEETSSAYFKNLDPDWINWFEEHMGCTVEELETLGIDLE